MSSWSEFKQDVKKATIYTGIAFTTLVGGRTAQITTPQIDRNRDVSTEHFMLGDMEYLNGSGIQKIVNNIPAGMDQAVNDIGFIAGKAEVYIGHLRGQFMNGFHNATGEQTTPTAVSSGKAAGADEIKR